MQLMTMNFIWSFSALAVVSSQVLGGTDFLSSRSTSNQIGSDNQIAGQYPPPDVEQQAQQYYQPAPYYQPVAEQQQQQYQPEYYQQQQQQQQQQQYSQNYNSAAAKQVGRASLIGSISAPGLVFKIQWDI